MTLHPDTGNGNLCDIFISQNFFRGDLFRDVSFDIQGPFEIDFRNRECQVCFSSGEAKAKLSAGGAGRVIFFVTASDGVGGGASCFITFCCPHPPARKMMLRIHGIKRCFFIDVSFTVCCPV